MASQFEIFSNGDAYEQTMGRWSRLVGDQVLTWLDLPSGLDWLDVGCGNGAFTEVIAQRQAPRTLEAVDPSPQQIAYAASRQAACPIHYATGSADALPFADGRFDATLMALVIGFVPDPAKAVAEMKRVTRSGGTVGAYFWDGHESVPISPFVKASVALGFGKPEPLPSVEATRQDGMERLWREARLERVETRRFELPVTFASSEEFWDSATELKSNPAVKFLDTASAEDIAKVRAWLDQNLPRDASGRVAFKAYVNAVKGVAP